jgi:PAS domain S-box-containing protein
MKKSPQSKNECARQMSVSAETENGEAQFRLVVEDQTEMICRFLPDTTLTFVNEPYCRIFGKTCEELIGMRFLELIPADEWENLKTHFCSFGRDNPVNRYEHCVFTPDGEFRWQEWVDRAFFDETGRIIEFQAVGRDITERKLVEERLRESEEQFRSLITDIHIGVLIQDAKAEILMNNQAALEMLGLTEEQLIGKSSFDTYWNVIHEDGSPFPGETHPVSQAIATRRSVRNIIMGVYRPKTEDRVWLLVDAVPQLATDGSVQQVICTFSNISERKRAEESRRILSAIVESTSDAIISFTLEGQITSWNPGAHCIFGYAAAETQGKHFSFITPPEHVEEMKQLFEIVRAGKSVSNFETVRVRKTGESINVSLTLSPIKDEAGKIIAVAEIVRDITELKREKEARVQLLQQLVTVQEEERQRIARELHDQMGQYLAALMIGFKTLENSLEPESPAHSNLANLRELTLYFSQEMRRFALELRPSALDDFGLQAAMTNYLNEWSERYKIQTDFHCNGLNERRLPTEIETTLYRIVQEALTNVQKHSMARRVSIIMENRGGRVTAVIEDDGVGFDVEAKSNAPAAERRLGLKGMRERVEGLDGALEIESTSGSGTTIVARIPVKAFQEEIRMNKLRICLPTTTG